MRASLLNNTLKALIKLGRPVAIEGPPGGGKTSIARQAAEQMNLPIIEKHMPTMLVEDFGIPFPSANSFEFTYKLPDWFPYQGKPGTEAGGVLLFDDRNQASADLQKVLANIQQARNLHNVPLAAGWSVVSTGNRQADRAGANRVLSHLRDRETLLELETNLDDSTSWMIANGVAREVISFLRFRPNLLHKFDPQQDISPTPRSWAEGVSAILGVVPPAAEYECFKGAVGEGAAAEFVGFMKIYRNLPDPDVILLDPLHSEVPQDSATLYALAGALADRATISNVAALCMYIKRMPAEFSVLCMSYAARRAPELTLTDAVKRWHEQHKAILY